METLIAFAIQAAIAIAASLLIDALFPVKITAPRLSDLKIQVSTYGNAIPLLLGPEVRTAGNVIWSTGLIESQHTSGGKGGPEVTSFSYRTSVAIALGEGVLSGVVKCWANGKLIYDSVLDALAPDQITYPGFPGRLGAQTWTFGTARFGTHVSFDTLTFYPGDHTQTPDPTIESYLGVGNVPGYRGTAYVVIKDLLLADFGNVLPNLEFLCVGYQSETVGSACEIIFRRAGIPENCFNADSMKGTPLRGYGIARVVSASQALAPLTFAYNFDIVDQAGDLRCQPRDANAVAIIPTELLGAHQYGAERPDPIQWERQPITQIPREATVTFADPDRDWQPNAASARRTTGTADSNITFELPLTLTVDQARALADRALWESWIGQQVGKCQSTDQLIEMQPGRVYLFETPAGLEPLRVYSKNRGKNGVIEFELRRERAEIYQSTATGATGAVPPQDVQIPGQSELITLDVPILRDVDDDPGFYFGVVGSETGWRGAQIYRALDASQDFSVISSLGVEMTVGDVHDTVPDGPTELTLGASDPFDDVTIIEVTLRHESMTLESVDDTAIAGGANICFIGNPDDTTQGEILQFGIATLQSGDTYALSHLRRGLRGTEFATSLHGPNEIFALFDLNTTRRKEFGVVDLNQERAYKAVSLLLDPLDVAFIVFANTGVGLRPFSPIDLVVTGDTGDDLVLSWVRRSRLQSGALGEQSELYTVRIMDPPGVNIAREVQVTEPTFTYTMAMQTADFGGAVSDLNWRVAQVSATYGNGIFATSSGPV